jgi:hypothetical protein
VLTSEHQSPEQTPMLANHMRVIEDNSLNSLIQDTPQVMKLIDDS